MIYDTDIQRKIDAKRRALGVGPQVPEPPPVEANKCFKKVQVVVRGSSEWLRYKQPREKPKKLEKVLEVLQNYAKNNLDQLEIETVGERSQVKRHPRPGPKSSRYFQY